MTAPRTWDPNYVVTSTDLNTELRDQLNVAFAPAASQILHIPAALYTYTGSTSWVDVDATNLAGTITLTNRTRLLFVVTLRMSCTGATYGTYSAVDIAVDGVRIGNANKGLGTVWAVNSSNTITLCAIKTGLSAGAHAFKLQYRTNTAGNTVTIGHTTVNGYEDHPISIVALEV